MLFDALGFLFAAAGFGLIGATQRYLRHKPAACAVGAGLITNGAGLALGDGMLYTFGAVLVTLGLVVILPKPSNV